MSAGLVLAMDTSTAQVCVVAGRGDEVLGRAVVGGSRRHAEDLNPAVEAVLASAGVGLADVAALGVGVGPGLFTGLRVGVTTAKVLALALDRPVVPVSSLEVVARPFAGEGRTVVAVADARRGEVYVAAFRGGERVGGERVLPPAELAAELEGSELLVGTGVGLLPDGGWERAGEEWAHPGPEALLALASERWAGGECVRGEAVQPVYLRKSDAELGWGTG